MLRYEGILNFSLVPSIIFFILSLASVALTTTYWIFGDWIVPRYINIVTSEFDDRAQQYVTDETIVYFTNEDTDATIVSGCLNLTAGVLALIAWSSLRKPDMDSQLNTVRAFRLLKTKLKDSPLTFLEQAPLLDPERCCHDSLRCDHGSRSPHTSLHQARKRPMGLHL